MRKYRITLFLLFVMLFNLVACGNKDIETQSSNEAATVEEEQATKDEAVEEEQPTKETETIKEEQPAEESENDEEKKSTEEDNNSDTAVNPELKEFLDEYETFMDKYIDFMKKYNNTDNTAELLSDYTSIMQQYAEFAGAIEQYNADEMSAADASYYLEVVNRVNQKMLKAL